MKSAPINNLQNVSGHFMKTYIILILTIINCNFCNSQQSDNDKTEGKLYAPIYGLNYPTDNWEITPENIEFLNNYVVDKIKRPDAPNIIINLEGHTDDVGAVNYNMQLSQKRVQAIADYLISKGIKPEQIKVTFFGESKPETGNIAISKKLKDIRYASRRVVVRLETE